MTRQATYQSGEEPMAGDLVKREGFDVPWCDVLKGGEYVVAEVVRERGYIRLKDLPIADWPPRGFSLVQRKEGKS